MLTLNPWQWQLKEKAINLSKSIITNQKRLVDIQERLLTKLILAGEDADFQEFGKMEKVYDQTQQLFNKLGNMFDDLEKIIDEQEGKILAKTSKNPNS